MAIMKDLSHIGDDGSLAKISCPQCYHSFYASLAKLVIGRVGTFCQRCALTLNSRSGTL
jgi:hypothetical protein